MLIYVFCCFFLKKHSRFHVSVCIHMSSYCVFLCDFVIWPCKFVRSVSLKRCSMLHILLQPPSLSHLRKEETLQWREHAYESTYTLMFVYWIKTLRTLVWFEHPNVNAVLTPAVVSLDCLLHSLSETLPYASVIFIHLCSLYLVNWSSEVTTPLSMKEVGGYIEKQVAYLSGESLATYWMISWVLAYLCVCVCV